MNLNRVTKRTAFGIVAELKRLWNDELLPMLRSSELKAGRGIRIQKLAAGIVISSTATASATATSTSGLISNFMVIYDEEKQKLKVGTGFVNCNGFCKKFEGAEIVPENGLLCLTAEKDGTDWKHSVKFAEFNEYNFPLAEIKVDGTDVQIVQYPVGVAVFTISKVCPLTRAGSGVAK